MPIHDVGYRSWNGALESPWLRWTVIAGTGIRLMWKSHWLRRMLLLSWLPTIFLALLFFLYEQTLERPETGRTLVAGLNWLPNSGSALTSLSSDPQLARHEIWSLLLMTFFRYPQGTLMVLLVGMIAPPLISQDFRSRAFLLYFARPITPIEYVLGKACVVWFYLAAITTLPALALYVLGVSLSPDLSVVVETWDLPLRILGASLILMLPTTALALFFSSMTTESRYAGFAWFAVWGLGWAAYAELSTIAAGRQWSLLSLYHTLGRIQTWLFGLPIDVGDVSPAAVMLGILTVFPTIILLTRVAAPMRV